MNIKRLMVVTATIFHAVIVVYFVATNITLTTLVQAESEIKAPQSVLKLSEEYDTSLNVPQGTIVGNSLLDFAFFANNIDFSSEQDFKDLIATVRKIYTKQVTDTMSDAEVLALLRSKFEAAGAKGVQSVNAILNPIMGGMFELRVQRELASLEADIMKVSPSVGRVEISLKKFNFPDVDIEIKLYDKAGNFIDPKSIGGQNIWAQIRLIHIR